MKGIRLTLALLSLTLSAAGMSATRQRCTNTVNGQPLIEDTRFLCDLKVEIDDLSGTGVIDQLFSKVTYTQAIDMDIVHFLTLIGDDRFNLGSLQAGLEGVTKDGKIVKAALTFEPVFYFHGENVCKMIVDRGELNIRSIETDVLPPFVLGSLQRIANSNAKLQGIMANVMRSFLPRIQDALDCP